MLLIFLALIQGLPIAAASRRIAASVAVHAPSNASAKNVFCEQVEIAAQIKGHISLQDCFQYMGQVSRGSEPGPSEKDLAMRKGAARVRFARKIERFAEMKAKLSGLAHSPTTYPAFLEQCAPGLAAMHRMSADERVEAARMAVQGLQHPVSSYQIDKAVQARFGSTLDAKFGDTGKFFTTFANSFHLVEFEELHAKFLLQLEEACSPETNNVLVVLDSSKSLQEPPSTEMMKSNKWMSLVALKAENVKIDDVIVIRRNGLENVNDLSTMSFPSGSNFILCDDATYSGSQMSMDMTFLARAVPKLSKVSVVLGGATTHGRATVEEAALKLGNAVEVQVFAGVHMRTFKDVHPEMEDMFAKYSGYLFAKPHEFGVKSVDVLAHKLADYMSTYPEFVLGAYKVVHLGGEPTTYILADHQPMIAGCVPDALAPYENEEPSSCMLAWYKEHLLAVDMPACLFQRPCDIMK